jgi:hypothetical protein
MKRTFWLIPLLVLLVVSFGCSTDSNSDENPFEGTWMSTVSDGINRKIIMKNDGTWEFHQSDSGDTAMDTRGTYTYTGIKATAIASEIYMEGQWMSTSGQSTEMITVTAEIQTDGKLKVTAYDGTFTYTKQ